VHLRGLFFNILVGIPGGCLIFMGMLTLNAVLGLLLPTGQGIMLLMLCLSSMGVGILARLIQPFHGVGTAISSGVIAALFILFLRMAGSAPGGRGLVFGPVGILVTIGFAFLGAWSFPRLRKMVGKRNI
jgi:hypothetical protein